MKGEHEDVVILGGGTAGSVANTLALILKSQGVEPSIFSFSGKEALSRFKIYNVEEFKHIPFTTRCAKATAVFLPNGIEKTTQFQEGVNFVKLAETFKLELKNLDSIQDLLQTSGRKIVIYHLLASGLEYSELIDKLNAAPGNYLLRNEATLKHLPKLDWTIIQPNATVKYELINSPQISIYPQFHPQKGNYIGQKNILDTIQKYITENTSLSNMSSVDSVFQFSKALDAHQRMDDGEYNGKLILSMDELLEDNHEKSIEYTDYNQLASYYIPSEVCYSMLESGRIGKIPWIAN